MIRLNDLFGYFHDQLLNKFQASLKYTLEYGGMQMNESLKTEICSFVDRISAHGVFGFDYNNEKQNQNRRKATKWTDVTCC